MTLTVSVCVCVCVCVCQAFEEKLTTPGSKELAVYDLPVDPKHHLILIDIRLPILLVNSTLPLTCEAITADVHAQANNPPNFCVPFPTFFAKGAEDEHPQGN